MPSKETKNYHLSQWEPGDAVRRVDFNADNAAIDDALSALKSTVSSHTTSLSSHSSSLSKLGNCQIYTGTYTGDGADSKTLYFSGYPVFVFIYQANSTVHQYMLRGCSTPIGDYGHASQAVSWTSSSVTWTCSSGGAAPFNDNNRPYLVLALLDKSK